MCTMYEFYTILIPMTRVTLPFNRSVHKRIAPTNTSVRDLIWLKQSLHLQNSYTYVLVIDA